MLESPQHRSRHSGRKTLLIRTMSFKVGILHQINTYVTGILHFFCSVLLCRNQTNQKKVMNSVTINHEPPITKMLFKMNWNLLGSYLLPLFHHSAFNKICCDKAPKFKFKLQYAFTTSNTLLPSRITCKCTCRWILCPGYEVSTGSKIFCIFI